MTKQNIKFEHIDSHTGVILLKILELKPKCSFCDKDITEDNFGGVFSKPTRISCNDVCCLLVAMS